jgi:hypothetical protein
LRTIISYLHDRFSAFAPSGHLKFSLARNLTPHRVILDHLLTFTTSAFPSFRFGEDILDYGHPPQNSVEAAFMVIQDGLGEYVITWLVGEPGLAMLWRLE